MNLEEGERDRIQRDRTSTLPVALHAIDRALTAESLLELVVKKLESLSSYGIAVEECNHDELCEFIAEMKHGVDNILEMIRRKEV